MSASVEKGPLKVGDAVELHVNTSRRTAIRANHSATHLLHEALRETLGTHVTQKGSLVDPDKLRFDFSHPKPLSKEELAAIEDLANAVVLRDSPVVTRLMAVDDAIAAGAMALFGEKYGEEVRVVSMGEASHDDKGGRVFSVELCGGTHVRATGEIGLDQGRAGRRGRRRRAAHRGADRERGAQSSRRAGRGAPSGRRPSSRSALRSAEPRRFAAGRAQEA